MTDHGGWGVWGLGHLGEPDSSQLMLKGMVSHLRMGEGRVPSRLIKVIIQLCLEGGGPNGLSVTMLPPAYTVCGYHRVHRVPALSAY